MPAYDELRRRFYERGAVLTEDELEAVYKGQAAFTKYNLRIDNTGMAPQEVASRLSPLL